MSSPVFAPENYLKDIVSRMLKKIIRRDLCAEESTYVKYFQIKITSSIK